MSKQMMTAAEIAGIMDVSKNQGYVIIRQLNKELESKGFLIRRGRIPRKYFYERTGLDLETDHAETGGTPMPIPVGQAGSRDFAEKPELANRKEVG